MNGGRTVSYVFDGQIEHRQIALMPTTELAWFWLGFAPPLTPAEIFRALLRKTSVSGSSNAPRSANLT
jgi:hypothetical protein